MSYKRLLNLSHVVENKSIFLLGPRQTGKSTLLRETLPQALSINLLHSDTFRHLSSTPERLREMVAAFVSTHKTQKMIVVDEIQKLPHLLDEIHNLIETDKSLRFILTGSSARKLRRAGVNLLGGRARQYTLHPITSNEFTSASETRDPVDTLVQWGGLPSILTSKTPQEDLEDYIGTYLREEIKAEALVRSIENFSRFLNVAALSNTEQVVFSNIASDSEVPARTVREYFEVLKDTLVGSTLPAFSATEKRKAMTTAKFYFFDVGVANALSGRFSLRAGTPEYGKAMEHLIWQELTSFISYNRSRALLSYWRSLSQIEVDFVLQHQGEKAPSIAIEVKAKNVVSTRDCKGLMAFAEEFPHIRKIIVSLEPHCRITDNKIKILPIREFLKALWAGEIIPRS